ncbi:MAG: hypothetical protein GY930_00925 [bacterium]|nr:hypothetical protein [bacterium]
MQPKESQPELSGLSELQRKIMGSFVAGEKVVIRAEDVQEAHPVGRKAANLILSRLHQKGWLRRLRRSVYGVIPLESETTQPAVENAWPLAMELFAPCYISGWSAAEHWDLTEQIFNSISLVTGHPQRCASQTIAGVRFRTRTIAQERIFGTSTIWFGSQKVRLADPHRLVLDVLDAPDFGGGCRHTMDVVDSYWKSEHHDSQLLLEYALRYGRGAVLKRIGFSAERAGVVSAEWLNEVEANLTKGIVKLDPKGAVGGQLNGRWRLKVNIPLEAK